MYAANLTPCTQPHNSAICKVFTQWGQGNMRIPLISKYTPTAKVVGLDGAASINNPPPPKPAGGSD